MLRVGRNEHVLRDVYPGARTLLYRDDGQTIQELVENLLALLSGLLRDPVAYLGVGGQDGACVADLRESTDPAYKGGGGERTQIVVVDVGSKAGRSKGVKADELVELDRETIWTDGPVERDE